MEKRGQIYIVTALIVIFLIFSASKIVNYSITEPIDESFVSLTDNFEVESSRVIHGLIDEGISEDLGKDFDKFVYVFSSYSKSQNPSYGLIYSLSYNKDDIDKIRIGNYFDKDIIIQDKEEDEVALLRGCYSSVAATISFEDIMVSFDNYDNMLIEECTALLDYTDILYIGVIEDNSTISWYTFNVKRNKPQLMIISRLEEGKQRSVFIGGEGFKPELVGGQQDEMTEIYSKFIDEGKLQPGGVRNFDEL